MTNTREERVARAIEIIENGEVDIRTGLGTFTAEERDTILRALEAPLPDPPKVTVEEGIAPERD